MSRALGVAAGVGIAEEVGRTGALGPVVDGLTIGVLSARSSATGVLTSVVLSVALLSRSALVVTLALVSAALQRVSDVCGLASADGSVIRSNLTISVSSTRSTNLVSGKSSAISKRIAGCSPRTSADGDVVLDGALRPLATGQLARIHALVVLARSLGSAVGVLVTFSLDTSGVRVAMMSWQTFTHRSASNILALSSTSTDALDTRVGATSGSAVGTSDVSAEAGTHGSVSASGAVSIGATGVALARVQSAAHVGIANVLGRTLAHGSSPIVLTERSLAARIAGARIKVAVGVRIAGVVGTTFAHGVASR